MRRLRLLAALLLPASLLAPTGAADDGEYHHYVGVLHEHSAYSDGWPGTTPETYYTAGREAGLDFFGSGEHSDNLDVPVTASDGCIQGAEEGDVATLAAALPTCVTDPTVNKWESNEQMAQAASTATYTAFRGFEWTSDRFGHINVYFSKNQTGAKVDGGYAVMDKFWKWLTTSPDLQGGADGVATFNHPGADGEAVDPGFNWNDFAYIPAADSRMVGLEVFNDTNEFGAKTEVSPHGYYVHALDKGWHVGAIGAEDLHGIPGEEDDYAADHYPKTVIIAKDRSRASLKQALLDRRFYTIRENKGLRLDFNVDGQPMGSRLTRQPGEPLDIVAQTNQTGLTVEVVTSGGRLVDPAQPVAASQADRYYFMRVKDATGRIVAYGSPVWVTTTEQRQWLAGDLHVHTCYSHDAYCGPVDDNTGPEELYTLGAPIEERFLEASARGLDYLAITDHNDVRSVTDPGFGTHGVIGIPGYENSLDGHAQMLGAKKVYEHGDGAAAITTMADELRSDGGVFQINHPAEDLTTPLKEDCSDTTGLDWKYGFGVTPDTVEVWNIGHFWQPPFPSASSNADAETYWECWLNRGHRVGATGGSDSHWLTLSPIQGPGNPTTWVFANDRTPDAILRALDEGRTSISLVPPRLGAPRLVLEADGDRDGTYESVIGDDVMPGSPMRARVEGLPIGGLLEIRANGDTWKEATLAPNDVFTFDAPDTSGWVYAKLSGPDLRDERAAACDPIIGTQTTYCRNAIAELALTSPIYLEVPAQPTELSYTGSLRVAGDTVEVSAKLVSNNAAVVGRTVTFTNRGSSVTATTDQFGVAKTTMVLPDHGPSQIVEAAFAGDNAYLPSTTNARLRWGKLLVP
jgi:hypothetical protein